MLILAVISIMPNAARAIWFWMDKTDADPRIAYYGNRHSQSFYAVKKEMLNKIYYDHRRTLYCNAEFTAHKQIVLPEGFMLPDKQSVDFKVYDTSTEELQRKALLTPKAKR